MNGKVKFHKANGPAFAPDQEWKSVAGNIRCWIIDVRKYGEDKWDYEVTYRFTDGSIASKNAWSFQVRYQHIADEKV